MTPALWSWILALTMAGLGVRAFVEPTVGPLNYVVTLILGAAVIVTWWRHRTITSNLRYLWPGAVLSIIGVASFVHARWINDPMSYAAALVPMGLLMAGCVMRPGEAEVRRAIRVIVDACAVLTCIGVAWSFAEGPVASGSMMVAPLALLVAAFSGRRRLALVLLVLNVAYLAMSLSSTLVVSAGAIAGFWIVRSCGSVTWFRRGVQAAVAALLLLNLISMLRPEVLAPVMQLETGLSGGIGQHSNSEFRFGVIRAASHDFLQASLWLGKRFTGTINATNVPTYLPWWHEHEAAIHSDMAIMILHGGLVGFLLIAAWWMGMLRLLVDAATQATAAGDRDLVGLLDATLLGGLVVAIFASFNPVLQQLGMMLPFYALVWLGALTRVRRRDLDANNVTEQSRPWLALPLIVEAASLVLLTPMVLLPGALVWGVPIAIALLWIGLQRWTGSAWPASRLNWSIAALVALTMASLLVSGGQAAWAAPKVATLILGIAWYFALLRLHDAGLPLGWVTGFLVAACGVLTVAGFLTTAWLDKIGPLTAITSHLPRWSMGFGGMHPNPVAAVLVLLAPLCIPLMRRAGPDATVTPVIGRAAAVVVFTTAIVLLVLTQSRGGWLAATTAALVLLLYRVPGITAVRAAPVVLAFTVGCGVVAFWTFVPAVELIGGDLDHKWMFRLEMWRLGAAIVGDFPWTGLGLNGFRHLATAYPPVAYPTHDLTLVHPHNMWLSTGVDLGIPGILAMAALWLAAARTPMAIAATSNHRHALLSQCVLASWVGFWTFGIADAIPLGTKLGTALWMSFAVAQCLGRDRR